MAVGTTSPVPCALGLGANLGDTRGVIAAACRELHALPSTRLLAQAGIITTRPEGPLPQPDYHNSAAIILTGLTPRALLTHVLEIERRHGRDRAREQRWGPRTLDIDILLYADLSVSEPGLTIPHPCLARRRFVLEPLARIAPDWVVPGCGLTVAVLLDRLDAPARE